MSRSRASVAPSAGAVRGATYDSSVSVASSISVVVTVFNDRAALLELLDALGSQTRRPDEVVVVDAGVHRRHA